MNTILGRLMDITICGNWFTLISEKKKNTFILVRFRISLYIMKSAQCLTCLRHNYYLWERVYSLAKKKDLTHRDTISQCENDIEIFIFF